MTSRIIDTHAHLWQVSRNGWYPGLRQMDEQYGTSLHRDYLLGDYRRDAGQEPITGVVHVSAVTAPRAYLDEAAWVAEECAAGGIDYALIGSVDPTLPTRDIVADLEQQAQSTQFRGVRVLYDFEPDSAAASTVLKWLEDNGKIFELVTHPPAARDWLRTLERFGDLEVVLEHAGWPEGLNEGSRADWSAAMRTLAAGTPMWCKVSGLGMVTMDLSADALRPWVQTCVETFGFDRLAFGSNFPIEGMAGTYAQLMRSLREILSTVPDAEQAKFFAGNAERIYGFH